METQEYTSKTLDHLGLVAGMCREIGISEVIDAYCPSESADQIVSTGKALEAMILNGLGFVNKRLYLISHFFQDKPVEFLLGSGLKAEHFNDDRLGRALDTLYEKGLTPLFSQLSKRTFDVLNYQPDCGHLDSTTISVHGQYNSDQTVENGLHITHGYSKDNRPDLPQVTIQMICEHLNGIPMHMEVLNGNSSDSESFRRAILEFGQQLQSEAGLVTIVADSKLYCEETIEGLSSSNLKWISRVPSTLKAASELIKELDESEFEEIGVEGYKSSSYTYKYGGVDQQWVVYHSQNAAHREAASLQRKLKKESENARKALKKLEQQAFHCEGDARQALLTWSEQWNWHVITKSEILQQKKYAQAGRPKSDEKPEITYRVQAEIGVQQASYDAEIFRRSLFILATNQAVNNAQDDAQLLKTYKEQHSVERGFRFIKDPNIVASSFFVRKPERVAALAFVMTTCLLVYSALEHRLRKTLQESEMTIPDQKGLPAKTPTTRWVFQLFVGIHLLKLPDGTKIILNLNQNHRNILSLLSYWNFYS